MQEQELNLNEYSFDIKLRCVPDSDDDGVFATEIYIGDSKFDLKPIFELYALDSYKQINEALEELILDSQSIDKGEEKYEQRNSIWG